MADGKVTIEIIIDGKKAKAVIDKTALQTEKKMKDTGKKAGKKFGAGFKSSIKNIAIGNVVAQGVSKAIAAITQAFKAGVQDLRDFSRNIAEINSILPANAKLTREAKDAIAGFSREFASDAQEQAKAFYNIVSAGVKGTADQLKTLQTANKAAVAGLVDINSAARVLIQSVNSYSKSGLTAEQASDSLFIAVREGVTTFGELSSFIGNTTAIAASSGVKFDELTGSIAFLTKQGITTDKAVIGLRQTIASIIKPTSDAAKFAKSLGIELNAAALKQKGFRKIMLEVTKATGGNAAAVSKLFGNIRAFNVVNAIANGNMKDFNRILDATAKSAGATGSAFEIISQNIDFQIKKTFAVFTSVVLQISRAFAQTFGTGLIGAAKNIQQFLLKSVVPVATAINNYVIAPFELVYNVIRDVVQFTSSSLNTLISRFVLLGSTIVEGWAEIGNSIGIVSDESLEKVKNFSKGASESINFFKEDAAGAFDNTFDGTMFGKGEEFIENLENNLTASQEVFDGFELTTPRINTKPLTKPISDAAQYIIDQLKMINAAFNQGLAGGLSNGIQVMTRALIQGKNLFDSFGSLVMNLMADMAIQMGKIFVATGFAQMSLFTAGAGILAGAALIAAGTVAKSFFGSGDGGGGGASSGGGGIASGGFGSTDSFATQEQEPVTQEPGTSVAVTIQGDVLDSDETGLRIVNLLQSAFDDNDVKVSGGAFA